MTLGSRHPRGPSAARVTQVMFSVFPFLRAWSMKLEGCCRDSADCCGQSPRRSRRRAQRSRIRSRNPATGQRHEDEISAFPTRLPRPAKQGVAAATKRVNGDPPARSALDVATVHVNAEAAAVDLAHAQRTRHCRSPSWGNQAISSAWPDPVVAVAGCRGDDRWGTRNVWPRRRR